MSTVILLRDKVKFKITGADKRERVEKGEVVAVCDDYLTVLMDTGGGLIHLSQDDAELLIEQ